MYFCKVLAGDIDPAIRTHAAFLSVWRRYGFTPEGFNLASLSVQVCFVQTADGYCGLLKLVSQ